MSSSPTAPTSTTHSSTSSSSRSDPGASDPGATDPGATDPGAWDGSTGQLAVIACGALAGAVREIASRRGWQIQVHPLPAGMHNRPAQIAPAAEALARQLQARGLRVALGYADCGSYGALDELCERLGIRRLAGLHCYDVIGGPDRVRALLTREPGTYLLTDYLVATFELTVLGSLGLDRHPELWADYFGQYRRLVWLAQDRTAALDAQVQSIAGRFGLPLRVIEVGSGPLERELGVLVRESLEANWY